jgi:hypothetical protein
VDVLYPAADFGTIDGVIAGDTQLTEIGANLDSGEWIRSLPPARWASLTRADGSISTSLSEGPTLIKISTQRPLRALGATDEDS